MAAIAMNADAEAVIRPGEVCTIEEEEDMAKEAEGAAVYP